jgi:hypothetical protein
MNRLRRDPFDIELSRGANFFVLTKQVRDKSHENSKVEWKRIQTSQSQAPGQGQGQVRTRFKARSRVGFRVGFKVRPRPSFRVRI